MSDTVWLRVKQVETGHELSLPQEHVDQAPDGAFEVLDKPGADPGNHPFPTKYKTTVEPAAAGKGQKAEPKKETV